MIRPSSGSLNIQILGIGIFIVLGELAEVLEEWMLFRVSKGLPLPVVGGIELAIKETV